MAKDFTPTPSAASPKGDGCLLAKVNALPLALLGDFVRGRMSESERQVKGLFESLLAESFGG